MYFNARAPEGANNAGLRADGWALTDKWTSVQSDVYGPSVSCSILMLSIGRFMAAHVCCDTFGTTWTVCHYQCTAALMTPHYLLAATRPNRCRPKPLVHIYISICACQGAANVCSKLCCHSGLSSLVFHPMFLRTEAWVRTQMDKWVGE